jgi:hypothetical protein
LGYVAGEMLVTEVLFATIVESRHYVHWLVPVVCAVLVLVIGKWLALRQMNDVKAVDLVDGNSVSPDQAR